MSSNRELAERLVRYAPDEWRARLASDEKTEWLAISGPLRFWTYNEDDQYTHNGDFCSWCKAEIRKQRPNINFSTHQIGDHWQASWTLGPSSRLDGTECLYTSEAAACVSCLVAFLESEHSPLDGLIPPVDKGLDSARTGGGS